MTRPQSGPVDLDTVRAALSHDEAFTVMEVASRACGTQAWEQRGNVRNRLYELAVLGLAICDEERPMRFALNSLAAST